MPGLLAIGSASGSADAAVGLLPAPAPPAAAAAAACPACALNVLRVGPHLRRPDPQPAMSTWQPPAGEVATFNAASCCAFEGLHAVPSSLPAASCGRPLPGMQHSVQHLGGRRSAAPEHLAADPLLLVVQRRPAGCACLCGPTAPAPLARFGAALACDAATTLSVGLSEGSQVGGSIPLY